MRTTSYAEAKNLGLVSAIGISVTVPRWFKGPRYERLIPPADLVKRYKAGGATPYQYFKEYRPQLDALDAESVYYDLCDLVAAETRGPGREPILCCWCKPSDFCHRLLVGAWFRYHGFDCYEIGQVIPQP